MQNKWLHKYSPPLTNLVQQRSSRFLLVFSQVLEWKSSDCRECFLSDCHIKTPVFGRSSYWLISIPSNNYTQVGLSHKMSDCTRRRLVREATKTPVTTLKELKASATELRQTPHSTTVAWVLHQSDFMGKWQRENHCWRKFIVCTWLHPQACGTLQGQLEESSSVWCDQNGAFWLCLVYTKDCSLL